MDYDYATVGTLYMVRRYMNGACPGPASEE